VAISENEMNLVKCIKGSLITCLFWILIEGRNDEGEGCTHKTCLTPTHYKIGKIWGECQEDCTTSS
jgi:hypothetical protein